MKTKIELTADEVLVIEAALEALNPVRIRNWDLEGYPPAADKGEFIEALLARLGEVAYLD